MGPTFEGILRVPVTVPVVVDDQVEMALPVQDSPVMIFDVVSDMKPDPRTKEAAPVQSDHKEVFVRARFANLNLTKIEVSRQMGSLLLDPTGSKGRNLSGRGHPCKFLVRKQPSRAPQGTPDAGEPESSTAVKTFGDGFLERRSTTAHGADYKDTGLQNNERGGRHTHKRT